VKSNDLNVGSYSAWLKELVGSLKGENDSVVPCGECVACCTSSHFVHIKPTDSETLKHVPRNLIFPAPGLPKGHYLLGYNKKGHCPMYSANGCTIYKYRPQTCRQYDCRIFAATNVKITDVDKANISRQSARWVFNIESAQDLVDSTSVKSAASFIEKYSDQFPRGFIPSNSAQRAVMAIRVYNLFVSRGDINSEKEVEDMISQIVAAHAVEENVA
jgi:uncharacterized protein